MSSSNPADQADEDKHQLAPLLVLGDLTRRRSAGPLVNRKAQREKRATRTKKACITCRRRHVKCDETWPLCLRCTRGAGLCEGYELSAPTGEPRASDGQEARQFPKDADIPTPQNAGSPDEKSAPRDPVILKLAEMASLNPDLREMMRRVADARAEVQEVITFQQIIANTQENLGLQQQELQDGRSIFNNLSLLAQENDGRLGQSISNVLSQSLFPSTFSDTRANSDVGSLASRGALTRLFRGGTSNDATSDVGFIADEDVFTSFEGREVKETFPQPLPPSSKQDVPFTDSGYASRMNVDNLQRMEFRGADTPDYDGNDLDTRTVYSGDSTVAIDQAQQYISELSSTIHGRLGGNIDADDWKSLSKRLLGLIKDFAIKTGHESSVQVNRDIMHFIHKRGREIAAQLDSMILNTDTSEEDADKSNEAKRDHMLLSDKMALWNSKAAEVETSANDNELFVGVPDVEETIDVPELFKYNKAVTESNSFKWLIETLRRELALRRDYDESGSCNHREVLRRKVIENLPTGKISKSRPPTTHSVAFRVPGWTLIGGAGFDRCRSDNLRYEAIVVTCCSEDAQAAYIDEYMEQTWPSTWRKILNLVHWVSVSDSESVYADILHDKTQVSVFAEHGTLIMNLDGPAQTIAECGEQLAWLHASYAHAPPRHATGIVLQRIPVIVNMVTLHGRVCFDIGVQQLVPDEFALLEQSRWMELLRSNNLVLIPGYPILRRPNAFDGIEVPPHYLLDSLGGLSRPASKVRLNGTRRKLSLVKQVKNVYLWHETQSSGKSTCGCSNHFNQGKGACGGRTIDLVNIESGRHIIGQCSEYRRDADDSIPALEREFRINDDRVLYPSSPGSLIIEAHGAESPKSTASSGIITEEIGDVDIVSSLAWNDTANYWAWFQYTDGNRPSESTESPLESDLLSMSDSSEELGPLADDDPIRAVLDTVVSRLVSGFRYTAGGEVPPCGDGQNHGTASSSSSRGVAASSRPAGKGRKRKQIQDDKSDSEEDTTHPRHSKRSRKTRQHIKLLACPFGKMSPSKHSACSRFQLKRIRDVKQHLKRKHTPDDYCNRCLSIFHDEESLTQHVSQADGFGCQLAPEGRTLDGISHRQSRDLSRKANAELSEEQQWFAIWDIVFPRKPRPESAYLDSAFAMQVCLFREHCARHAEPLLAQNLRAAGLLDERMVAPDQGQLLRRVISESLDSICDNFSTNGSSDSGIGRTRDSIHNETPAASMVDSGIGIGSQMAHSQPRPALLTTPVSTQQNIRPGPTEVPPDFQTPILEEVAALSPQSSASSHQPGLFSQASVEDFLMNHNPPNTAQRPDELATFNFDLSTDNPLIELSQWDFS